MSSNRWGAVSQHIPAENQMEKSIMKFVSASRQIGLILGTLAVLSVPASAWSQEPQYKANVPKSLITPDKVQTELLGELEFTDGMPSDATVRKTLDFLDLSRAAEAFLNGIPPTSIYAMLEGLKQAGAEPGDLVLWENYYDARSLLLTPNTTTLRLRRNQCQSRAGDCRGAVRRPCRGSR